MEDISLRKYYIYLHVYFMLLLEIGSFGGKENYCSSKDVHNTVDLGTVIVQRSEVQVVLLIKI